MSARDMDDQEHDRTMGSARAEVIGWSIGLVFVFMIAGVFIGTVDSVVSQRQGFTGCHYSRAIAYVNPFYIGTCELLRIRWER